MIRLAIDGMGGDFAPEPIVKATLQALEQFKNIHITLFGDQHKMAPFLKSHQRLEVVHTESYLDMGEKDPIKVFRTDKSVSMFMAMQAVADGKADAIVSAGPTQALVVGGSLIIKKMPQMRRVGIAPIIPSLDGRGRILMDSGANVELRPEHLLDFALYASVVAREVMKRENPQVALINIGSEEGKGRELDREAHALLKEHLGSHFYGNLEPKEIFVSEADIFVTDGFTGNIVMKTMEGTALGLGKILKREIKSSFFSKIGAVFMKKSLKNFKKSLDASEIGGALVMGLNHVVIKAHGSSNDFAFYNAIRQAKEMVEHQVIEKVKKSLDEKEVA